MRVDGGRCAFGKPSLRHTQHPEHSENKTTSMAHPAPHPELPELAPSLDVGPGKKGGNGAARQPNQRAKVDEGQVSGALPQMRRKGEHASVEFFTICVCRHHLRLNTGCTNVGGSLQPASFEPRHLFQQSLAPFLFKTVTRTRSSTAQYRQVLPQSAFKSTYLTQEACGGHEYA